MKYVIIGAGAAGISAAETLRKQEPDSEITVISKDEVVHSRCMLHFYLSHERSEEELNFVESDFFEKNIIEWLSGREFKTLNPGKKSVHLDDGRSVDYDRLLIATGADSFIPPVKGLSDCKNVLGLRDLSDAKAIDSRINPGMNVVIIGSGLVGLDAAYGLSGRDVSITVVEQAANILPLQLNSIAATNYQRLFEEHGVNFMLGNKAVSINKDDSGDIREIVLENGHVLSCDLLILAVGVSPSYRCIAESGVETDWRILVDAHMRTNIPEVFAAGDATGLSAIWPNAVRQGQIAAYNMCGLDKSYEDNYHIKNTINFFGLPTLSLGFNLQKEGDLVYERKSAGSYQRIVLNGNTVRHVIFQGDIKYTGIWQYLIKNKIDVSKYRENPFKLSYANFYGTTPEGKYTWVI